MNTRVSQFELRQSVEPNSNRAERSTLQPEWPFPSSSAVPAAADSSIETSLLGAQPVFAKSDKLASRIPCYLIGLLLTATAIAKLWMLLTDSFADIRVGLPKEILWLSVAFELWLAFENFRVRDHRVMAFVNTIVFASLAIFASLRFVMGYSSCGCSGNVEIPAWVFILIDVGIAAWFTCSTARRNQIATGLRQFQGELRCPKKRGRFAAFIVFASFIVCWQLPAFAPLRTWVLGEPPIQAIVRIDGNLVLNQESFGRVEIQNQSGKPTKIIGITRSCRCFDLLENPVGRIVPVLGGFELPMVIKPNKLGLLHQRVELFLDHPKQLRVNVDVFGSVKGVK